MTFVTLPRVFWLPAMAGTEGDFGDLARGPFSGVADERPRMRQGRPESLPAGPPVSLVIFLIKIELLLELFFAQPYCPLVVRAAHNVCGHAGKKRLSFGNEFRIERLRDLVEAVPLRVVRAIIAVPIRARRP